MKIPVNDIVSSGEWLLIEGCAIVGAQFNVNLKFKIRLLEFSKISPQDIKALRGNSNTVRLLNDPGNLWILKLELINVGKIELPDYIPNACLILYDQDDCQFSTLLGCLHGDVGIRLGLERFYTATPLQPKIKVKGAVAFFLPDEDGAEYFISTKVGSIKGA